MTTPFTETYWKENYGDPKSMDGIGNAKQHARYIQSYFGLEYVDISSVADLGFGYGHLFKEVLKTFKPHTALGIEPSPFAFKKVQASWLKPTPTTKIKLQKISLADWCEKPHQKVYDLGICTSVLQYIPTKDLKKILPVLAQRVKYLYLSVPTNVEFKRQQAELEFHDTFAIHRTREEYQKLLKQHFTIISSRVLESKVHFNETTTPFTDLLFRN